MEEQDIEETAMRLANRAYLHRLFHIAFGAEPSGEELGALGSPQSVEAARYLAEREGSSELSAAAELLASLGGHAGDAARIEALRSDYNRLFVVPGDSYVHPWESPYIGKEAMLFQESTLDVRHRYREHGFAAAGLGRFPEDHISMMLDFLAHLSSDAFEAFGDGDDAEVARILASQRDFSAVHLLNWVDAFCGKLREKDSDGAFLCLAEALSAFLAIDERFMARMAGEGGGAQA